MSVLLSADHNREMDRLIPRKGGTGSFDDLGDTRRFVTSPATPVLHPAKSIFRPNPASTQSCFLRIAVWYSSSSRNRTDGISNDMKMRAYINPESSDGLRGQNGELTKLVCVLILLCEDSHCEESNRSYAITMSKQGQANQSLANVLE